MEIINDNNQFMQQKTQQIYQGKAKIIYATTDNNLLIQYFKDSATAFNGIKKEEITGKGILNNAISAHIMATLSRHGIDNHFVAKLNDREQLIKKVKIIPLEVIVRNVVAGSLAKRLGLNEGALLIHPIFEICYKNDSLNDPLINDDQAVYALQIIEQSQLNTIKKTSLSINNILQKIFLDIDIKLIDFKIEFGFDINNNIILADEISPDSCRLWDANTQQKLDKDLFRHNLGNLIDGYKQIANRFNLY
jgi:phosphoribosylaminoimidazole-succinocarboxamide synthase